MARPRLTSAAVIAASLVLTCAGAAHAQQAFYSGLVTAHLGAAHGGDVRGAAVTPGASMAAVDQRGIGAEVDFGYSSDFDESRFADSTITSLMVNVLALYPHPRIRPFIVIGAGLLRVRAAAVDLPPTGRTDFGFDAGGGAMYMLSEDVALRADVRFFRYFEGHADVPTRDGGLFGYWRTSIGATYAWPMR